jgi:hypothetical protein
MVEEKSGVASTRFRVAHREGNAPACAGSANRMEGHTIAVTTAFSKTLCWANKKEAGIWSRKKAELLLLDSAPHNTDET